MTSHYDVRIAPQANQEIRALPGYVRQPLLRAVRTLRIDPRPSSSRELDAARAGLELEQGVELRRIRFRDWRVVYTIEDNWNLVTVMAVRKRPPYQYQDLAELLAK